MEPNAENYNPGHYAIHNRGDLGRALPGDTLELTAEKFREELDVYDKEKWLQLSSIRVPQPKNIKKTTGRKKTVQEKTPEQQREYCDYLNTLIRLLPRAYYVLR